MSRKRLLSTVALGLLLVGVTFLAPARSPADPITAIDGHFYKVAPAGTDLAEIQFRVGDWHELPNPSMTGFTSDLTVRRGGSFPSIETTEGEFRLLSATDSSQMAVFTFPSSSAQWNNVRPEGFFLTAELIENTIRGANLTLFERGALFHLQATGVTVDPATNTATVSEGAFADFTLEAPSVPEPASAALLLAGGLGGMAWTWFTRRPKLAKT